MWTHVLAVACAAAVVASARVRVARPAGGAGGGPQFSRSPTLDDLWTGEAHFAPHVSHAKGSAGFADVDAGTRVVVVAAAPVAARTGAAAATATPVGALGAGGATGNTTWYLFGRTDTGPTAACPQGEIGINVRASTDLGLTWGEPSVVVQPSDAKDNTSACLYADGTAFFDASGGGSGGGGMWHYLVQVLDTQHGGWCLAHFTRAGASPLGGRPWDADPHNPVVTGGALFNEICAGAGKHCKVGMRDEGTPEIVGQGADGDFYVTFHGYDYDRRAAARGIARTADFVTWKVTGGAENLPGDVIFTGADCTGWNVTWASGGCIGSGEASVLRSPRTGYLYQVIEATDVELTCDLRWGGQWWPLGLVRSKTWAASPQWEQMPAARTPFVGGPGGGEPHVGCSVQYNSLHRHADGTVFLAFWDVSFHAANASAPDSTWHLYELVWGRGEPAQRLPMAWPGPTQRPVDCATEEACRATCTTGFEQCASDGYYYCCDAAATCTGTHTCAGNPGLSGCACDATDPGPLCPNATACRAVCPGFAQCQSDGWFYCCGSPNCTGTHACAGNPGLEDCACGPDAGGGSGGGGRT